MRTYVSIDGFNLYYGALKGTPFKWLDVKRLVTHLVPQNHQINKIKYFTARVSGAADRDAPRKQAIYLRALRTIPEVEIHFGNFLAKTIWRPLLNLPVANETISTPPPVVLPAGNLPVTGNPNAQTLPVGSYPARGQQRMHIVARPLADAVITEVHSMEEKGSDVNLAAHLLNDAWKKLFDAAVVISNDTDLTTPIRMVTTERALPVFVVCPGRWTMSPKLIAVASYVRHIRGAMLRASQFPDPIPGTTISKPIGW